MLEDKILTILLAVPLIGAAILALSVTGDSEESKNRARIITLATTTLNFVLSLYLWYQHDPSTADFQFTDQAEWLPTIGVNYHVGVDGISVLFVLLTTFLMPICALQAWSGIHTRVKEFMVSFLILETTMIGVFVSLDFVLFYLFFEGTLIPMFLIIGIWGGENRVYATFKFFLYTLLGSLFLLIAMIYMIKEAGTAHIPTLMQHHFGQDEQYWLWLAFFASFAVKTPMWPFHTWLPDAHPEAPTKGSVILAGVLLKMGGYGFLRFSIPMLPHASDYFAPLIFGLSLVAIVYTSLVALAQTQMKKLIAYSSVAHMGFVTIGLFTLEFQGVEGAMFQMISHGLTSAALFLAVGVLHDRIPSYQIDRYGGLAKKMPLFSVCMMIFILTSVGLPGTSGFVGEILILIGAFKVSTWVAFIATTGIILGAAYSLWFYRRVVFGKVKHADIETVKDLSLREVFVFAPLVIMMIWLGINPGLMLDTIHASVDHMIQNYKIALAAEPTTGLAFLWQ